MADTAGSPQSEVPGARRHAILFADLVESVLLYQRFEAETIQRWRAYLAAIASIPSQHGGRLVRTAGDGLLMEFASVSGAVATAHALHAALQDFNDGQAAEATLALRVAVHVAAVVVQEHELYGAGVNVAARLASLAAPGQTLVTAQARAELGDGVCGSIEDLGARYVKHLDEPLRAFAVHPPGVAVSPPMAPVQDLRPVVAVIPFSARPADAQVDALGHAMADDIIASLARHPGLRVVSRVSAAALRDVALDPQRVRELLGAAFVLTGHFYVHAGRIRLAAELAELHTLRVLWTGSARAEIDALFDGQDELVPALVAQVAQHVMAHEVARARSLPMQTLSSYSLFLGAEGLITSLVARDFERARELLLHLGDRHPRQAAIEGALARWHVLRVVQEWSHDPRQDYAAADQHAARALELDDGQALALTARGLVDLAARGDLASARRHLLAALERDPQAAEAWAVLAGVHSYSDEHDAARAACHRALACSPLDPNRFLFEAYAAMAEIGAGHYAEAVSHARASVRQQALHAPSHLLLVGALWLDGRHADARLAAQRALSLCPGLVSGSRTQTARADSTHWRDRLALAAHAAGLP